MSTPCLLVMAGGTGGHIFPALAVADALQAQGWRIVWLGNPAGMEGKIVADKGYPLAAMEFKSLRGKGLMRKLQLPLGLLASCMRARQILREVKPDVVLGMGGYISFPGGLMARMMGIPLVIHEQNAVAGMANRWLAKIASRVLTGFPQTLANGAWVGNPIRTDIAQLPAPAERYAGRTGPLRLLVIGGSLGAQVLNEIVPLGLALIPMAERPTVVHQSGKEHFYQLTTNYQDAAVIARCEAFIEDMSEQYAWADIVICRAGASTIAELTAAGLPALLIPYPSAVDDHQTVNARFLSEAGAAFLMAQATLTPATIAPIVRIGRAQLQTMAEIAHGLAKPEATATVAEICKGLVS